MFGLFRNYSGSRVGQKVLDASRSTTPALVSDTEDKLLAVVVDVLISVEYAQFSNRRYFLLFQFGEQFVS